MKKFILLLSGMLLTIVAFSQNLKEPVNKPLTAAQKMTIELSRTYNLTGEQVLELNKIQEAKLSALAKIEGLRAQDMKKYILKRLSAFETADNALMSLLDERQIEIFKKQQIEKSIKFETIVEGMKKEGFSQIDIQKKLAETTIKKVNDMKVWKKPIVTQITSAGPWTKAEGYHQDYLQKTPQGYTCHFERKIDL